jgi:hypothetical protein
LTVALLTGDHSSTLIFIGEPPSKPPPQEHVVDAVALLGQYMPLAPAA